MSSPVRSRQRINRVSCKDQSSTHQAGLQRFSHFVAQLYKLDMAHATPESAFNGFQRHPVAVSGETPACNDHEMKLKRYFSKEQII